MTSANYPDDLELFTKTPTQAEFLLYRLEQAAADIILYANANKTESICFKQEETISI